MIPNPVAVECLTLRGDRSGAMERAGATPPVRSVLALGRLTRQKGFDYLLDAWAVVIRRVPDAHLTLVGEGEDKATLRARARRLGLGERVTFSPFVDDVAQLYRAASLFVLSSRFEGLPMVLLEAQTHGLPIVAFDCPYGPREIITDGIDGVLCEAGNPQALAEGLIRLLENSPEREAMSVAARQASGRYALPAVLDQWNRLFAEMEPASVAASGAATQAPPSESGRSTCGSNVRVEK